MQQEDNAPQAQNEPTMLNTVAQALRQILAVCEHEQATTAVGIPAELQQAIKKTAQLAAHYEAIEQQVGAQLALIGSAENETAIIRLAQQWAQTRMRTEGLKTIFEGRAYLSDVPVTDIIVAYKKFVGLPDFTAVTNPKKVPAQPTQSTQKVAAQAAAGNNKQPQQQQQQQAAQTLLHTPRRDAMQTAGIAQELARLLDTDAGMAVAQAREALVFMSKTISAESLRKNTQRSRIHLLNAVGVYVGVLDAKGIGTADVLPPEAKTHKELCRQVWQAAQEWRAECDAIQAQIENSIA